MSLRRLAKLISFFLLFALLAWYARLSWEEGQTDILIRTWNRTFRRLNEDCFYWILLRLTPWILIYLHLLRLESGFSIYLFLRQHSYTKVFARTYGECIGLALCYYGGGTLIMAVCHGTAFPGATVGGLLCQAALPRILAEEGLEALSFCLVAYAVHCIFRNAEIGFLAALVGRMALNFASGGTRPALPVQLAVSLGMTVAVFLAAFRDFTEKYIEE